METALIYYWLAYRYFLLAGLILILIGNYRAIIWKIIWFCDRLLLYLPNTQHKGMSGWRYKKIELMKLKNKRQ